MDSKDSVKKSGNGTSYNQSVLVNNKFVHHSKPGHSQKANVKDDTKHVRSDNSKQ